MFENMFGGFIGSCPSIKCNKCNAIINFSSGYIPKEGYCSNCGQQFTLSYGDDYKFPNIKYDETGRIIREESL